MSLVLGNEGINVVNHGVRLLQALALNTSRGGEYTIPVILKRNTIIFPFFSLKNQPELVRTKGQSFSRLLPVLQDAEPWLPRLISRLPQRVTPDATMNQAGQSLFPGTGPALWSLPCDTWQHGQTDTPPPSSIPGVCSPQPGMASSLGQEMWFILPTPRCRSTGEDWPVLLGLSGMTSPSC